MKSTGLMFKPYHVPKILYGIKTMTRRLRGLDIVNENPNEWILYSGNTAITNTNQYHFRNMRTGEDIYIKCPYGKTGDEIWMKETYMS